MASKVIEGHKSSSNFVPVFSSSLHILIYYESILLKIYMNANIMNSQIFNLNNYDLKGH